MAYDVGDETIKYDPSKPFTAWGWIWRILAFILLTSWFLTLPGSVLIGAVILVFWDKARRKKRNAFEAAEAKK